MYTLRIPPLEDYVALPAYKLTHVSGQEGGELDPFLFPSRDEIWEYNPFVRMRHQMEKLVPKVKRLASGIHKRVKEDEEEDYGLFEFSTIEKVDEPYLDLTAFEEQEPQEPQEEPQVPQEEPQVPQEEQEIEEAQVPKEEQKTEEAQVPTKKYTPPFRFEPLKKRIQIQSQTRERFKNFINEMARNKGWNEEKKKAELKAILTDYLLQTRALPLQKGFKIVPSNLGENNVKSLYKKIGNEMLRSFSQEDQETVRKVLEQHQDLFLPYYSFYIGTLIDLKLLPKKEHQTIVNTLSKVIDYVNQIV